MRFGFIAADGGAPSFAVRSPRFSGKGQIEPLFYPVRFGFIRAIQIFPFALRTEPILFVLTEKPRRSPYLTPPARRRSPIVRRFYFLQDLEELKRTK